MLKTSLKLSLRSLLNNKLFTFINVGGLACGMTIALLLFLYIRNEISFDQFHSNKENIYRLVFNSARENQVQKMAGSPNIAGPTFKADIPEIKEQIRLIRHEFGKPANTKFENKVFFENNVYWTDSNFCKIFDIDFVMGSAEKALSRPNSIIINETTVKKYFGNKNPIGKVLKIDNAIDCEITGVYKDFPANSSLDADFLGSISTIKWMVTSQGWSNASFETYFLLNPNSDYKTVEKKINDDIKKKVAKEDIWFSFSLQPFSDVHLSSADITDSYIERIGDKSQVEIVGILTLIILIIAGINYMNLSTAQSQMRFKEIGISKTIGATKISLIKRFYTETTLLVFISLILSILLTILILPYFNSITNCLLHPISLLNKEVITIILLVSVGVILFSGLYPAHFLSSFNPKDLFNQNFKINSFSGKIRQLLVVFQFTTSIVLVFCTIVLYKQLTFIQTKNLGFKPDQVIAIPTTGAENKEQISALLNDTKALAAVKEVCRTQTFPGKGGSGRTLYKNLTPEESINITTCRATAEILDVLDLKLLTGTKYTNAVKDNDTLFQIILNKTAVDFLGYTPQEAIGKKISLIGSHDEIVGVVDDFHFESVHTAIGAYAFHNAPTEPRYYMLLNLESTRVANTLDLLQGIYKKDIPNGAFDYIFLDNHFKTLYKKEIQTANLTLFFSGLAIILACLGLFGLSAFMISQRKKEIGIRKVIGATLFDLVNLISKKFITLVVIASVIAFPLSWYLMNKWLSNFAYHISINWFIFLLTILVALISAGLSVSFHTLRAAMANPVNSIRKD